MADTFNLDALTHDIAATLPTGWIALPDPMTPEGRTSHPRLRDGETGVTLYLSHGGYQKEHRITIAIDWPVDPETREHYHPHGQLAHCEYEGRTTSITVSETKSAKAIAADITRRLLPDATHLWGLVQARMNSARVYRNSKEDNLKRIAAETGNTYVPGRANYREEGSIRIKDNANGNGGYIWNLQVSDNTVSLDVRSVPIDVAIQIMKLVKASKTEAAQ